MRTVATAAHAAHNAGIAVVPVLSDGSKRPPFPWSRFQTEKPTEDEISEWFSTKRYGGFALICGPGSGNLEVLDFDDGATYEAFCEAAKALGLGGALDRIREGYEEQTPSGGFHLPYYCATIGGNQKLARRANKEALIETRGIGGYVIAAPSNGTVHESGGAWRLLRGSAATIATITPNEREHLLMLARSFDELPPPEMPHSAPLPAMGGTRPGDDFRDKHRSLEGFCRIVEPHGWKLLYTRNGSVGYFQRPGKRHGASATFNNAGSGLFYVFSTSTAFDADRGYNPFSVYAVLNHDGDYSAAAKELIKQGYGKKTVSLGSISFTKREKAVAFHPTEIPEQVIRGWFADYLALVEPTTEAPDAFHVASAITVAGSCIGKRVGLMHASDVLFPNFYTLLIGPSGRSRKDTAIRRMLHLFYARPPSGEPLIAMQAPFKVVRDISSSEGMIARLRKDSNLLLYTSEFSKVMSNAARESTRSIGPTLIEAFDCPPSLQNNTKANVESSEPMEAKNPFVSVLSTVQPEILAEIIGSEQQYSGFLNRWWLVPGDGKGARPNPPDMNEGKAWRLLRTLITTIGGYADGALLRLDADAEERWARWYVESYPTGKESPQEDAMGIRRGTMVKKIALVQAVSEGAQVVTEAHIELGIALSDWSWEHTRRMLPTWGESKDAELARKISERLNQRGPMKKKALQQLVGSRMGPGVFARIIKSMAENGEVVLGEDNIVAAVQDE